MYYNTVFGHNYYMYKNPETGKWIFIPYDFDNDLGSDLIGGMFYNINCFAYVYDWPLLTYKEFAGPGPKHILDILIHNDETSFIEHVKSIVRDVFNPTVLFEHIDEIKKLIGPYVLEDKTEDPVTGIRPGRINKSGKIDNEYMLYVVNSEFTTISTEFQTTMGLKRWILDKFRHACKIYDLDCSFAKEYLEGGSFTYEINQEYENPGLNPSDMVPPQPEPTETEAPTTETQTPVESCWSDVLGYPCCESTCVAIEEDDDGSWSWENNHWCGINSEKCQQDIKKCWSLAHGYPCCQKSTTVYEKDENGSWGYEDHHWCGIIPSN